MRLSLTDVVQPLLGSLMVLALLPALGMGQTELAQQTLHTPDATQTPSSVRPFQLSPAEPESTPTLLSPQQATPSGQMAEPVLQPSQHGAVSETAAPDASGTTLTPRSDESVDSAQVLKASLSKTTVANLTLEEALRRALENNPTIEASHDQSREQKDAFYTQLAGFIPDMQLSYYGQEYNGRIQIFGNQGIDIHRIINQPSVIFTFPIFQGGRHLFLTQSAHHTYRAQQYVEKTTQQQILNQTAQAYYTLLQRLDQIAVAQKQLDESQVQLDANQARADAGVGTRLDVLQSKALVANGRQRLLDANRAAQVAALYLNELLDLPAFMDVVPAQPEQHMRTLIPAQAPFNTLLTMALKNRPELKGYFEQLKALKSLRNVAWSALFPDVNVAVQSGGIGPNLGSMRDFTNSYMNINLTLKNLTTSVFTEYKRVSAQSDEILHRMEAGQNQIQREVSEAYLDSRSKQEQIQAIQEEVSASELALSDAMERLNVGVGRNIDVVQAETSLTEARTRLAIAVMDYNQAQVRLVQAMGLTSVESLTKGIPVP